MGSSVDKIGTKEKIMPRKAFKKDRRGETIIENLSWKAGVSVIKYQAGNRMSPVTQEHAAKESTRADNHDRLCIYPTMKQACDNSIRQSSFISHDEDEGDNNEDSGRVQPPKPQHERVLEASVQGVIDGRSEKYDSAVNSTIARIAQRAGAVSENTPNEHFRDAAVRLSAEIVHIPVHVETVRVGNELELDLKLPQQGSAPDENTWLLCTDQTLRTFNTYSQDYNETIYSNVHAQTLVMAIAFACIWSPQNCMAPNLTQIAEYFHFSEMQRDTFLGAYIALATGVFSLPVSALIGFIGDIVPSRRSLYAATVFVGGLASLATGMSTTYTTLYVSRFICGGCMAGSLPVAFSLLGDFFDVNERNAASAGLTAAMGGGMILGQVLAGMVGPTYGWQYPFYICGTATVSSSALIMLYVTDPVRGGKEAVLQEMMKAGRKYDRKLTLDGFLHALKKNRSNALLISQGFFTSIPWGIIFVFLNDYLSQECGLSVPQATYLVGVFAIGAAIGGIAGGWCGQYCSTKMSSSAFLPLFMGVSTLLGILPFWGILNGSFVDGPPWMATFYAISAGIIANLPSCNVRPALINVNLPEARGATLTAANLVVNLARGIGPMMLTSLSALMGWSRAVSFQMLLIINWIITGILQIILAWTYPKDQAWVETELCKYIRGGDMAAVAMEANTACAAGLSQVEDLDTRKPMSNGGMSLMDLPHLDSSYPVLSLQDAPSGQMYGTGTDNLNEVTSGQLIEFDLDDSSSLISIEDPQLSFEMSSAKKSFRFMGEAMREIGDELSREFEKAAHNASRRRFWLMGNENDHVSKDDEVIDDVIHAQDESFVSLLDEQAGDILTP